MTNPAANAGTPTADFLIPVPEAKLTDFLQAMERLQINFQPSQSLISVNMDGDNNSPQPKVAFGNSASDYWNQVNLLLNANPSCQPIATRHDSMTIDQLAELLRFAAHEFEWDEEMPAEIICNDHRSWTAIAREYPRLFPNG